MSRIYPLYSSSSGNCTYIGNRSEGILIDCGVSFSRLKTALDGCGIPMGAVKAVFITHCHSDHIKGLKVFTKKTGVPVFAQSETLDSLIGQDMIHSACEDILSCTELSFCKVMPFETSHDTIESCGYRIDLSDGSSCGVCTDLGFVSEKVTAALSGCGAVLAESNYDDEMLRYCSYPLSLKERIRSDRGHLSNIQCAELCGKLISMGTRRFILGHISKESNSAERALEINCEELKKPGYERNKDYIMTTADPFGENLEFTVF